MADEGFQEKTERATPRKKAKAREQGRVARSRDLTSMFAMGGVVMVFYFGGEHFISGLANMTSSMLSLRYGTDPMHVSRVAIIQGAQIIAPVFLTSVVLVIVASVAQGGFVLKPPKLELSRMNPLAGIGRMFSFNGLSELLKSIVKFAVGVWIVYYVLRKDMRILPSLSAMELNGIVKTSAKMIMEAVIIAFSYFMVVAFISYAFEKWQYERSLRMTKQEIKEESKESEGDPLIKSRIRSLQREAARKRMMQEVPKATVVITNPTHLAVAIKYEDGKMFAPQIVAKGAGIVAAKIREIATEHGVPIVEDKPLARTLFKLELNSFIPEELYTAVAKLLAYIYKMKGKI